VTSPLLEVAEEQQDPLALTDEFFMYKYKTRWCPIGVQHEWHSCVYAHNYQDARRPPSLGYGARICPYWSKKDTSAEYFQRCPLGLRCPYSHGAKEQLYHPMYFKTVTCRDLRGKVCPRQHLCAFFHTRSDRRAALPDEMDYAVPLPKSAIAEDWAADYLQPPFLSEHSRGSTADPTMGYDAYDGGAYGDRGWDAMASSWYTSAVQMGTGFQTPVPEGMSGPFVLLCPVGSEEVIGGGGTEAAASPLDVVPSAEQWVQMSALREEEEEQQQPTPSTSQLQEEEGEARAAADKDAAAVEEGAFAQAATSGG